MILSQAPTFQEFMTTNVPTIPLGDFVINLVLTAVCCYALAQIYVRYGRSLSNRTTLARNFMMVGATTMLIITIVKSSLALSLGLVGALSIVRFRTAIKEPEELAYLFITISLGLGLGAGQRLVTVLGFTVIVLMIFLRGILDPKSEQSSLYLIVSGRGIEKPTLEEITSTLKHCCAGLTLRRFEESAEQVEASYRVNFDDYAQLEQAKFALRSFGPSVSVSFVDNEELG